MFGYATAVTSVFGVYCTVEAYTELSVQVRTVAGTAAYRWLLLVLRRDWWLLSFVRDMCQLRKWLSKLRRSSLCNLRLVSNSFERIIFPAFFIRRDQFKNSTKSI
jgi:hypothetical protein